MDVSGGLSLMQAVIENLGSSVWTEIVAMLGVKSQLRKLKKTMSTIEVILGDVEEQERLHNRRHLDHVQRYKLERLKEALYQADDLFDEVTILAHHKKLMPGNKLRKEVCLFFSRFNQLRYAFNWSREIKDIRETLDDVIKDFYYLAGDRPVVHEDRRVGYNPMESHSYVSPENDVIIGRDNDKRILIDMLKDTTNAEKNVCVVSIVGIGGLGKTALAQLVYNDEGIQKEFPLKMWVHVSNDFNVKILAGKILAAATNQADQSDDLTLDQLQQKLRQVLDGNKYLLVLDDVWNENFEEWRRLKTLLVRGGNDSRILVTTRSKKVAGVVGGLTHELQGLLDEDSWSLFQSMAHPMDPQLHDVGKEIVGKCANVPLAIRMVGSLLQGQGKSRWENLRNNDHFSNIVQDETNGIVHVLKISYYDLPFHLKNCFSYCAIFPKDYRIVKEDLICLWMAQGFIIPSDGENFEDVGDMYFEQLLQRCFFQDVELAEGSTDEIVSCKMHDLIHDLAIEVAGKEILSCDYSTRCVHEKARHVSIDRNISNDFIVNLTKMERMRTFLRIDDASLFYKGSFIVEEVSKVKYLRVLSLKNLELTLPSMIGELVHLRYLDLSYNKSLSVLPSSITMLYNLQTLKFYHCWNLKCLPRDMRKLVNLRHLDIYGCISLKHMPAGMNSMASLKKLTRFVVSGTSNGKCNKGFGSVGDQLRNLKNFTSHSDILEISVEEGVRDDTIEARERGILLESRKLRKIRYSWNINGGDDGKVLLQSLQPHCNLRRLELWRYPGVRLPTWMMNLKTCLPNLVELQFRKCRRLEHLPLMSQLHNLKVLILEDLDEVVHMESTSGDEDESVFFPSLKKLMLCNMPKLKGWWKSESSSVKGETLKVAELLSQLGIEDCPNLTTFPVCPKLEELVLLHFNEALDPIIRETTDALSSSSSYSNEEKNKQQEEGKGGLRKVDHIDNVGYLTSLPIQSFHRLSHLEVIQDQKMERLRIGEAGEVFRSGRLSSLQSLHIYNCSKLKSISGRELWEHFTALQTLALGYLDELNLEDEDDVSNSSSSESTEEGCINEVTDEEMPWRYLAPTLRSLELSGLPKLVRLPKGIGCLSSLQDLNIMFCSNLETLPSSIGGLSSLQSLNIMDSNKLKSMPEEIRHLTSLTELYIRGCSPELKNGVNWSDLKHIPCMYIE